MPLLLTLPSALKIMFTVPPEMHGHTLAAVVRLMAPPRSWSEARRLIQTRRVRVNGNLTLDSWPAD